MFISLVYNIFKHSISNLLIVVPSQKILNNMKVMKKTTKQQKYYYVITRLAAQQFNGVFLGIKDPKHRKKISLRAMDVILFGAPGDYRLCIILSH